MNIIESYTSKIKSRIIKYKSILNIKNNLEIKNIIVETPPDKFDFDLSSNAAMIIAKITKNNPRLIAEKLKEILKKEIKDFSSIEIAGPGFLNFKISNDTWHKTIKMIFKENKKYGSNRNKKNFNIEFVSANPTGPMHVGHCRGAIFGDVLSNLLVFNGGKVTKEFYINDYGNQIQNFVRSIFLRIREIKFKENFPDDKELYSGNYVKDIAKAILIKLKKHKFKNLKESFIDLKEESLNYSLNLIKKDLKLLGIKHDLFFSETNMVKNKTVDNVINKLKKKNFVYEGYLEAPKSEDITSWKKNKRLIFNSTNFGDDTDRALQKDDGTWTYFANDIGYHSTKIKKKYDTLINILGADHIGYIKRISAAVSAMSNNKTNLVCKVCQLVKFLKDGEPFKMSKRSGDFFPLKKLLNEVNKDSIRFMMLYRSNDVELEFDFKKVLEKNKDNPVFYVQYCYARINSIFRTLKVSKSKKINLNSNEFRINSFEQKLLKKIIEWPKIIEVASNKQEPHRIPFYLYELSTLFHSYWSKGNDDPDYKFIKNGKVVSNTTLKIFQIISIILENGMSILGVSLPKKM